MACLREGAIGIEPPSALGSGFFLHLTEGLSRLDGQVFFLERRGSASGAALRIGREVHRLSAATHFKPDLVSCYDSGVRPEVVLEENLTLHRLGVYDVLGASCKTTNCIESVSALIEERCAKVYAWKNSNQRHRWPGTALLDIEPRLRRVRDYRPLPELRDASKRELKIEQDPTRSMIRGRRGRLEFQLTMGLDSLYLLNITSRLTDLVCARQKASP